MNTAPGLAIDTPHPHVAYVALMCDVAIRSLAHNDRVIYLVCDCYEHDYRRNTHAKSSRIELREATVLVTETLCGLTVYVCDGW